MKVFTTRPGQGRKDPALLPPPPLRITRGLLTAACLLLLWSCGHRQQVPRGIIKPAEMRELMWDMINAGEFINAYAYRDTGTDHFTTSARIYSEVLQVHKISRQDFDRSYMYYRQHPKLMMEILDSLSKRQISPEDQFTPAPATAQAPTGKEQKSDTIKFKGDTLRPGMLRVDRSGRRDSMLQKIRKLRAEPR